MVAVGQSWVRFSGRPGISGNAGCDRASSACTWDFVRHEALHYRMEVKRLHPLVCRSRLGKLRAARAGRRRWGWEQP